LDSPESLVIRADEVIQDPYLQEYEVHDATAPRIEAVLIAAHT